jgi:HAD superfamily hydrolase (TIGR01549 family)
MRYALVIFDMDGTLTRADDLLNFQRIRAAIGLAGEGPLLEQIHALPDDERHRALSTLHQYEQHAAEHATLQDGAVELLAALRASGRKTALLTRNSPSATAIVLRRHGLSFDHVATRDDLPHKPHPDSILNITRKLSVAAAQTLMVGDYLYDLQAAQRAGVASVLLCADETPAFADQATYCVRHLGAILALLA